MLFISKDIDFALDILQKYIEQNDFSKDKMLVDKLEATSILEYVTKLCNNLLFNYEDIGKVTLYDLECNGVVVENSLRIMFSKGFFIIYLFINDVHYSGFCTLDYGRFRNTHRCWFRYEIFPHVLPGKVELDVTGIACLEYTCGDIYFTEEDFITYNAFNDQLYYINLIGKRYFQKMFEKYNHDPTLLNIVYNNIEFHTASGTNYLLRPGFEEYDIDEEMHELIWGEANYRILVRGKNQYINEIFLAKFLYYNSPDTVSSIFEAFRERDYEKLCTVLDSI